MNDEYTARITRFLQANSVSEFRFIELAKHRAVIIHFNGTKHQIVFPKTGSDWRGPANTISTIRHTLGIFKSTDVAKATAKVRSQSTKPTPREKRAKSPVWMPPAPAPSNEYLQSLLRIKARLEGARHLDAQAIASIDSASVQRRISLRTPWLGKRPRYAAL